MRYLLFGLVVFAAGGLLGAALIRPGLLDVWIEQIGRGSVPQAGEAAGLEGPAPLPPGESWGRVLIGSPALPPKPAETESVPGTLEAVLEQGLGYTDEGLPLEDGQGIVEDAASAGSAALDGELARELLELDPGGKLPEIHPGLEHQPGFSEHVVQKGETLSSIAGARYGRRERALVEALARFNRLPNASNIDVGQRLSLPPLELLLGE